MPNRKNKIISLRLSEEEYESLKSVYSSRGVRSFSEFARDAMQKVISETFPNETDLHYRVQLLDGKVALLEVELSRLSRTVGLEFAARKPE